MTSEIRFNSSGAFIGTLKAGEHDGSELNCTAPELTPGSAPLLWNTFLAVPYIDLSEGYAANTKFSGSFEAGNNSTSPFGRAVDAFAHHVLEESQHTCVLVDLQGIQCSSIVVILQPELTRYDVGFVHKERNEIILIDPQAHTQ